MILRIPFGPLARRIASLVVGSMLLLGGQEAAAQVRNPNRPIQLHDKNGDGKISPEEWPLRNFKVVDKNKDGFLTPDDFAKHWGVRLPGQGSAPGGGGLKSGNGTPGGGSAQERSTPRHHGPVQWIDTHVHAVGGGRQSTADYRDSLGQALAAIGDAGFARAILMPPPQLDRGKGGYTTLEGIVGEARQHPGTFAVLGGGGSLNPMINLQARDGSVSAALRERFRQRAEEILAMGAVGFGEMTALHFSLTDKHPFESVPADHPLFLLLADIAASHDVPIDLHIEPVVEDMATPGYLDRGENPKRLKRNIDGFERLLAHNRKARIVWAHAGTALLPHRTPELTRELMEKHPNLYLQVGVLPGKVPELGILGPRGVKAEWLPLLRAYADRIVVGGDQFFSPAGNRGPAAKFAQVATQIRKRFQKLLSSLPPELARQIGYENAVRIYKLDR